MDKIYTQKGCSGKGHQTIVDKENRVSCAKVNMHDKEQRLVPDPETAESLQVFMDKVRENNNKRLPNWDKRIE